MRNMENKQTALEWFSEEIASLTHLMLPSVVKAIQNSYLLAKEMEKEQIVESHEQAYIEMNMAFRGADRAEQYYNETYGE
jgi:hypothetical protein